MAYFSAHVWPGVNFTHEEEQEELAKKTDRMGKTLAKFTILRFVDEFCYKILIRARFSNAKDYTEYANRYNICTPTNPTTLTVRIAGIREVHNYISNNPRQH
ncbi:hypothetical protein ACS0PU_004738 [Formica fusca]